MSRLLLYRPKRSRILDVDLTKWLNYYAGLLNHTSNFVCGTRQDSGIHVEDSAAEQDVEMNISGHAAEQDMSDTDAEDDRKKYTFNFVVTEMSYFPMRNWFELLNHVSHVQYMLLDIIYAGYLDLLYNLREGINVEHFISSKYSLQKDIIMKIVLKQLIKNCSKNSKGHDSETEFISIIATVLILIPDYEKARYITNWIRDRSEY